MTTINTETVVAEESSSQPRARRSRSEWKTIIEQYESSGLSAVEFSRLHNLSYQSLAKWRSTFRNETDHDDLESTSGFIELSTEDFPVSQSDTDNWSVELVLKDNIVLRIR